VDFSCRAKKAKIHARTIENLSTVHDDSTLQVEIGFFIGKSDI
jgi:hypothetical protein